MAIAVGGTHYFKLFKARVNMLDPQLSFSQLMIEGIICL
jgi:hypothetical protein